MGTENVNPISKTIKIRMTAIGNIWAVDEIWNFMKTNEFQDSNFTPFPNNESIDAGWDGWDFVSSLDNQAQPPQIGFPAFAYGLYKIYTDDSPAYFYIDFRDDRYGRYEFYQPSTYGHNIDIWLKYSDLEDNFYITSNSSIEFGNPINYGQLLKIWEIKRKGLPQTNEFPDYWENCLVIIESENTSPRLV